MDNKLISKIRSKGDTELLPKGSEESLEWFRTNLRKRRKISSIGVITEGFIPSKIEPGKMFTYKYKPKFEKKLEYYDIHPLIIVLDETSNGWYGANLHYLSPKLRSELLLDIGYYEKGFIKIRAELENNPITSACLKRYIAKQVVTRPVEIPKDEWDLVVQLPYEGFVNSINRSVWLKTRKRIKGPK
ncbi:MAG: hypothetical protein N0C84_00795 [Candidatus Thiodiazotropha taylori]|uniref:DNA end protector protein n=1 Tax=Candidatus Thiodiazotropha taylori TaxID=2792791 RepID=A0A9E4KA26_9GAMM|nr:hypothetical protein [Candidatus Thiodiazotropha taylori]MCW4254983.1 hypothetical protein [Candidatus Thiodiazotropha taylori]